MNWEAVCSPKNRGGLGPRIARDNNVAMLGKLVWSLATSNSKLRVRPLHGSSILNTRLPANASPCWKAIQKTIPFLRDGFD